MTSEKAVNDPGVPSFSTTLTGAPLPAQWTSHLNGAALFASSMARWTSTSSSTVPGENTAFGPRASQTSAPGEEGRSSTTTFAPRCTNSVAVASPSPDAPPVINAEEFTNGFFMLSPVFQFNKLPAETYA